MHYCTFIYIILLITELLMYNYYACTQKQKFKNTTCKTNQAFGFTCMSQFCRPSVRIFFIKVSHFK